MAGEAGDDVICYRQSKDGGDGRQRPQRMTDTSGGSIVSVKGQSRFGQADLLVGINTVDSANF